MYFVPCVFNPGLNVTQLGQAPIHSLYLKSYHDQHSQIKIIHLGGVGIKNERKIIPMISVTFLGQQIF